MISTRENLLIRPWQQRKYEYHKRKVMTATPVIDTTSPPYRAHVAVKLKKIQKENERSQKIERDNLILLQKLNYIMTTHWLDNYLPPQPTFLSRVGVYRPTTDSGIDVDLTRSDILEFQEPEETLLSKPKCRKLKCIACSPHKYIEIPKIPEERVPWEPEKKEVGRRIRSRSVPPRKTPVSLPTIREKPKSASSSEDSRKLRCEKNAESEFTVKKEDRAKSGMTRRKDVKPFSPDLLLKEPNSITLSRGSLKLKVNFPPDTAVKFDKQRVGTNLCKCLRNINIKS